MTLRMVVQDSPSAAETVIDVNGNLISQVKILKSYTHPSVMTFKIAAPAHTRPIRDGAFVQFWDDADEDQTAATPLFEGFVDDVQPGRESNEVFYKCLDSTRRATRDLTIMSQEWEATTPPVPSTGSIPRKVFNSKIDNDEDYMYESLHDGTLAEILSEILDELEPGMQYHKAAPAEGGPYDAGDMALGALQYKPQEKFVCESEGPRSAIERLLHWAPTCRLLFEPGTRKWRIVDITAAPQVTLTIDDWQADYPVEEHDVQRSMEGRATAVRIYGPPALAFKTASTADGSLTTISSGVSLQNSIATCCDVPGLNQWQITDPDFRRVARILDRYVTVQIADYTLVNTKSPVLQGYWEQSSVGNAGWRTITGWYIDSKNGIISMQPGSWMTRYNPAPAGGSPNYENPTAVRFIYCTPVDTISVRYPESGFAGTAYTESLMENEHRVYDEMLAVGYEYGTPVTTETRKAQYLILAQTEHTMRKDVVYTGAFVLDGLDYQYKNLNKRINIAAKNAHGDVVTGWEAIAAYLTDVEYDFATMQTTLQLSSDQMELAGIDPEEMKKRLQIRALEKRFTFNYQFQTTIRGRRIGEKFGLSTMQSVHETSSNVSIKSTWIDPTTGMEG